ncbi:hypothetical protein ACP70R_037750 [Stipagrostis hirtigluma subsp. patula]
MGGRVQDGMAPGCHQPRARAHPGPLRMLNIDRPPLAELTPGFIVAYLQQLGELVAPVCGQFHDSQLAALKDLSLNVLVSLHYKRPDVDLSIFREDLDVLQSELQSFAIDMKG